MLICLCIIATSALFYCNKETVIKTENRYVTKFPSLPQKISTSEIQKFFAGLSMFFNDNFPGRAQIIEKTASFFPFAVSPAASSPHSILGKDSWLFLGNSYNSTIDKLTGKFRYYNTNNKKFSLENRFSYYQSIAQKTGAGKDALFFLVAPNKTSIYPEYLPKTIIPASQPFHIQLLQKMQETGYKIYYPRHDLVQAKQNGKLLYYVTDSHWNNLGAYTAFIKFMNKFFPQYSDWLNEADFTFKLLPAFQGDIVAIGNYTFTGQNLQDNYQTFYKGKKLSASPDMVHLHETQISIAENPDAPIQKSVWLIGDSFSGALQPLFQLAFSKVYFCHSSYFEETPAFPSVQADFVVFERVERNF